MFSAKSLILCPRYTCVKGNDCLYLYGMRFFDRVRRWLKGIQVYALVGESGTGKSFRAKLVAQKYRIDLIIDDGLVIKDDKIIAGYSAKREKSFLAAVKVAVFDDKQRRDQAAKALQRYPRKKILILGTSDKMVNKIAMRLQILPPQKIIRIEDIATREEIETAIRSRRVEGKHVIPVPSTEVKRNYPQIFYAKIRLLFRNQNTVSLTDEEKLFEKSVVRPVFSRPETLTISATALKKLVLQNTEAFDPEIVIKNCTIQNEPEGYRIIIMIDMPFATDLGGRTHTLQDYIVKSIERYAGISIKEVNIVLDKIIETEAYS